MSVMFEFAVYILDMRSYMLPRPLDSMSSRCNMNTEYRHDGMVSNMHAYTNLCLAEF